MAPQAPGSDRRTVVKHHGSETFDYVIKGKHENMNGTENERFETATGTRDSTKPTRK
jgi:hypothetical protein